MQVAALLNENFVPVQVNIEAVAKLANEFRAICHAGQLLISADAIRGRKMTGWKSIVQDIKNAGAEFIDQEVVVDGNLVSSRHPGDLPAFIKSSLKLLS
jgi:protease I